MNTEKMLEIGRTLLSAQNKITQQNNELIVLRVQSQAYDNVFGLVANLQPRGEATPQDNAVQDDMAKVLHELNQDLKKQQTSMELDN